MQCVDPAWLTNQQIFGGLVAYGIQVGSEKHGSAIEPWKIVFLVNGLLTAALGVVFWFVIPDNQLNARWLSPKDRVLAVARVRVNQQGIGNKHFKLYQLKEALLDPMTWAFVFYALVADIPNGGTYLRTRPTGFVHTSQLLVQGN